MVKNELIQILKYLISNNDESFTIRELSLVRKINYKSAYEVVKKLQKDGCINIVNKGNSSLCQFNKNFTDLVYLAEKERLQDILNDSNIKIIYRELQKVKTQSIVLLFGSYAKKTNSKSSDIDLLIVSNNAKLIEEKISWIPKKIDITSINYNEFDTMLKSKEFTVVSEVVKNNVILQSIEDYYRFVKI
jgi:predicted nucleotidyltransferase